MPSGDIIFNDKFTETNDTALVSHIPDIGTSWTQIDTKGAARMEVVSSTDYCAADSSQLDDGETVTADATYPSANYQISITLIAVSAATSDTVTLLGRYTGQANNGYYIVDINNSTGNDPTISIATGVSSETVLVTQDNSYNVLHVNNDVVTFELAGSDLALFGAKGNSEIAVLYASDANITVAGTAALNMGAYWIDLSPNMNTIAPRIDDFTIYTLGDTQTSWNSPTTTGETNNDFTNPTYAYSSDDSDATVALTSASTKRQDYGDFGFTLNSGDTVRGIEVKIETGVSSSTPLWTVSVEVSNDNGSTWSTAKSLVYDYESPNIDRFWVFGYARSLWGLTWAPADLNDTDFRVRVSVTHNSVSSYTFQLDHVQVKVVYDAPTTSIKTINGLAKASVKTMNGLVIASVKTWNGLT